MKKLFTAEDGFLSAWFLAMVVAGYPFGIVVAQNMAAFFIPVFALPLMCISLSSGVVKDAARENAAPLKPPIVKRVMICAAVVIAAWHGAFWTAAGALLWMVLGIAWTRMHNTAVGEIKAATRPAV